MRSVPFCALIALVLAGAASMAHAAQGSPPPLMRFPTTSATELAFVARGDLWIAPRNGGLARRVVTSDGHISAAQFSPDGQWIAYTGRRGGGQDVYIVAAKGGEPRRLTYDSRSSLEGNLVSGWTPDSRSVVFLSDRKAWASKVLQAFVVPVTGGLAERLPAEQSGLVSFSPDGDRIAFTRSFTNFDTRKRYIGGLAQDIFIYDFKSHDLRQITDWKGTDTAPMWSGRRIYFLSDRGAGFRANIWCYDLDTSVTHQITHFSDYDIDWPSLNAQRITFQEGGRLWALDLPSEQLHELTVEAPDDGAHTASRRASVGQEARSSDVSGAVDYAISPDGAFLSVSAHGDVFSVAIGGGQATDITATPATDEDHPAWSADGRNVAYVTEADGALQVAIRPGGGGAERRLTHFATGVLYTPTWSPDGASLAVADAEHGLWWVHVSGAPPRLLARDPVAEIRDAAFSADGRWLAYSTTRTTGMQALHLQDLASGRDFVVSSPMESDRLPAFSPDGKTLYFVSQRHELPFTSDRGDEATVSLLKSDGIYSASLTLGGTSSPPGGPIRIDTGGLMERAIPFPVEAARIVSLETRGSEVIYETRPPALMGGELPGETAALRAVDVPTGRERVLVSDLDSHALSLDGRHVAFRRARSWRIAALDSGTEASVDLSQLRLEVDPRAEWAEVFERAWRLDRDLFFSRVMNGDDWGAVHDAYARFVPQLGSRDDLIYLLGELQGEMATSHAFTLGLDETSDAPSTPTPRLGADLTLDAATGRYRLAHIYRGDATRARFRSPLGSPGLAVEVGDYLLAIEGQELRAPTDPDALLMGRTGDLTLSIASLAEGPRHEVRIRPLNDELDLRQYDWVEANRHRVSTLSDGRIGYVFMANFGGVGSEDFARQLQPQLDKQGLIFDVRWNWGGFTSQAVLNVLKRVRAGEFVNREGALEPLPLFAAPRAMAAIANAATASDGDQFAYFFQAFGLGPVVGQRTWGGVQGIKGPWPLMNGLALAIPKDSLASPSGHWLIENEGAVPDIVVDPAPDEGATGRDHLLEAAVRAVLDRLASRPAAPLQAPAALPAYPAAGNIPGSSFNARVNAKGD